MAAIIAKTLREKTSQELQDQLVLEKKKLFDGIVKGSSGEAIKAHEKREGRRLVARIQTILSERAKRKELDATIKTLEPKAAKATASYAKLVKSVEERGVATKGKPHIKRIRTRHFCTDELQANSANREAVRLAEAKRVRIGLTREDMGQGK